MFPAEAEELHYEFVAQGVPNGGIEPGGLPVARDSLVVRQLRVELVLLQLARSAQQRHLDEESVERQRFDIAAVPVVRETLGSVRDAFVQGIGLIELSGKLEDDAVEKSQPRIGFHELRRQETIGGNYLRQPAARP